MLSLVNRFHHKNRLIEFIRFHHLSIINQIQFTQKVNVKSIDDEVMC